MLIVVLNFLCLIPRIVSQVLPEVSLAHFENYINLDRSKNRYVSELLHEYYTNNGLYDKAKDLALLWNIRYPEIEMLKQATYLKSQKKYSEAVRLYNIIIQKDPFHFDSYNNMAECYMQTKEYNKAGELFDIARGMSPYNPGVWNNIAWVNFYQKKYEIAENAWLKSIEYDSTNIHPFVGLMSLYYSTNNRQKYIEILTITVKRDDAPGQVNLVYGDLLVQQGRIDEAIKEYDKAIAKGVDPLQVEQLKQRALKLQ